jgi:hypothetical protein
MTDNIKECPICKYSTDQIFGTNIGKKIEDIYQLESCIKCGRFSISLEAVSTLSSLDDNQNFKISAYLANNQGFFISNDGLDNLINLQVPSVLERNNLLLSHIAKKSVYLGDFVKQKKDWISKSWCKNEEELEEIVEYLVSSGVLAATGYMGGDGDYKLTIDGWKLIEELEKVNSMSNQVFIAMWFDTSMTEIYSDAISPAIIKAGFMPLRIDEKQHNDKIDDEIISQIRRSKFVVADFTGHRGGVYFEAGFAKGLGLEVIWLCRKDQLSELHFDIRQYNCIVWSEDNLEKLKSDLQYRIESVFGRGPNS